MDGGPGSYGLFAYFRRVGLDSRGGLTAALGGEDLVIQGEELALDHVPRSSRRRCQWGLGLAIHT